MTATGTDLHRLLRRQLARHAPGGQVPAALDALLEAVDQAYRESDNDRSMLERSLELSSQELLQANAALRALVSAFPDQLLRLDRDGTVLDVRGGGKDQARRWATNRPLVDQLPPGVRASIGSALTEASLRGAMVSRELDFRADTSPQVFEARIVPLDDGDLLLILRDVTAEHLAKAELTASQAALHEAHRTLEHRVEERTRELEHANNELRREFAERQAAEHERAELEVQLRHAQKMEAVGRLAGGIAHDFNNLLTAVQGYSELLINALEGSPLREDATEIHRAAERASLLTRQLLAFSRRQLLSPEVIDATTQVVDLSRMLSRLIGERIRIDLRLTPDPWPVRVDADQLEQAIVNLALNARDAMPAGGPLVIQTANRTLDDANARALEVAPGDYVAIVVSDAGTGIPAEVQARVFEPFFTTKPKGQGTGLGLSMVYGFVRQSEGAISFESREGEGTSFTILLPRADRAPDQPAGPVRPPLTAHRGEGTVLVAEDEPALRRLATTVLGQAGYRTLAAPDGRAALELFDAHAGEVDIVVTDVVMPRLDGLQFARSLRERRPDLPLIYMTGYAEEGQALRDSAPDAAILLKPFSPGVLLDAVAEALAQRK
ncbi:MAG: ATP-binding protein [Vicinamibacterales bacterium]